VLKESSSLPVGYRSASKWLIVFFYKNKESQNYNLKISFFRQTGKRGLLVASIVR
jgi:hypothetical protein